MDTQLNTADYLFMKYRSITVDLVVLAKDYYPHVSKAELLRRANNQDFPFSVFKIDKSKRAPFLVNLNEFSRVLEKEYEEAASDFATLHR